MGAGNTNAARKCTALGVWREDTILRRSKLMLVRPRTQPLRPAVFSPSPPPALSDQLARQFSRSYLRIFLSHAPLSPSCCACREGEHPLELPVHLSQMIVTRLMVPHDWKCACSSSCMQSDQFSNHSFESHRCCEEGVETGASM